MASLGSTPERLREYIKMFPVRNPLLEVEEREDGTIALLYKKNFKRFEGWLYRRLGGPDHIRRPLDHMGTVIWGMCDGSRTVEDIAFEADRQFKEEIAPALARVSKFVTMLQERNLVFLFKQPVSETELMDVLKFQGQVPADKAGSGTCAGEGGKKYGGRKAKGGKKPRVDGGQNEKD